MVASRRITTRADRLSLLVGLDYRTICHWYWLAWLYATGRFRDDDPYSPAVEVKHKEVT